MIVVVDVFGSGIDDGLVVGNVLIMLLVGEDMMVNMLVWMIYLLWCYLEVFLCVMVEVCSVVGIGFDGIM